MSYHIYTTPGIILKRRTFGESDTVLYILTRDLGLIIASAKSTRLMVSKLRSGLQEYSVATISCIKGKNGWKITNVVSEKNLFFDYPDYAKKVLAQVAFMLTKGIVGELPQKEIFETVESGFRLLGSIQKENVNNLEVLMVLRVMHQLGYVALDSKTEGYIKDNTSWDLGLLEQVQNNKKSIIELINESLRESQL